MAAPTLSYTPPLGSPQPGSNVSGGGGGYPIIGARNALDMRRMMMSGRTPDAQYPDGYLGTTPNDRHADKLLNSYGASARYDRTPTRGVHRGGKLDRDAYKWPSWMTPMTGIERQSRSQQRWAPVGRPADVPTFPGSNATPQNSQPLKASDLAKYAPTWRW